MKPLALLLAACSTVLASCATPAGVVEPVVFSLAEAADSIPVAYGATATIERMLLTFNDVPADSRCPTRVQCASAGDATVSTGVTLACTRSVPACAVPELQLMLHTNVEPRAGAYAGLEIRLLSLRPVPDVPGPIRKARYVAWFQLRPVTN
jgi:hypothetical protein